MIIVVIADEAHRSQYDFGDGFAHPKRLELPARMAMPRITEIPTARPGRLTPQLQQFPALTEFNWAPAARRGQRHSCPSRRRGRPRPYRQRHLPGEPHLHPTAAARKLRLMQPV